MRAPEFELDHVGIAVGDLDAAQRTYARLGFTLSSRSFHSAPPADGGKPLTTGTGNHCVMLERGYVELIGVTDPGYRGRLLADLARYAGIHIVAFGTEDAPALAARLARTGYEVKAARVLNRDIVERGRPARLGFAIVDLPATLLPEGHFLAIQHLTRDDLWQPHLLTHANGAKGLAHLTVCMADPADFARRLAAALGAEARSAGTETFEIELAAGLVRATSPAGLARRYTGVAPPVLPWLAGIAIAVDELAPTAAFLARAGVTLREGAHGARFVPPGEAAGAVLEFVASA